YGLLDEAESQALVAHLGRCDACRAARAGAERQQQVIAVAAKAEFPGVRFAPPVLRAEPSPRAVALNPGRPRRWGRWAGAAAVLLAAGLGLTGGILWYQHAQEVARAREDHQNAAHARAAQRLEQERERQHTQQDLAAIQEEIRLLEAAWQGEA